MVSTKYASGSMALDMRALYYVTLPDIKDAELYSETVKANENNLNQNFTAIAQKIEELETRLSALE